MKRTWLWVAILLTVFITFYKLGDIPSAFYWDEAALGYDAHSLIKTGTDEYGARWPMYFKSAGDYKYPAYSYLSMIPVAIIGLSTFSARFISALSGVVTILIILKIAVEQSWFDKKNKLWLVLGVLLAVCSPWYLLFARTAREATLGMALSTTGFWALTKYWSDVKKNYKWLMLMIGCFGVAAVTYSAFRMFLVLLMVGLTVIWIIRNKWNSKLIKVSGIFAVIALTMVGLTLDPGSRLRAENTLNLMSLDTILETNQEVGEVGLATGGDTTLITVGRVFNNKFFVKGREWVMTYLGHFDMTYLFADANPELPWYHVPNSGLLLLIAAPLFFIGLFEVGRKWGESWIYPALIWWLLIAEVASALTIESPNPIRQIAAYPVFVLIILLGLSKAISWGGKWWKLMLVVVILVNSTYGVKQFFIHREYHMPYYTNQNFREIVDYVGTHQNEYSKIVLPEEPYIFFLFWGGDKYGWKNNDIKTVDRQWASVVGLQNIVFMSGDPCPKIGEVGVLYGCIGSKIPKAAILKKLIRFNDGMPQYSLIEFKKIDPKAKAEILVPQQLPEGLNYLSD